MPLKSMEFNAVLLTSRPLCKPLRLLLITTSVRVSSVSVVIMSPFPEVLLKKKKIWTSSCRIFKMNQASHNHKNYFLKYMLKLVK